jgi:hypothetical protein
MHLFFPVATVVKPPSAAGPACHPSGIGASAVSFAGTAELGALLRLRRECETLAATLAILPSPALRGISDTAGLGDALA